MNEERMNRQSKIYTYFYGKNIVFQQFMLIVGVLLFLLSSVAAVASSNSHYNKWTKLRTARSEANEAYSEIYYECRSLFDIEWEKSVDAKKDDENYDKKREYNKALDKYLEAEEDYEAFSEKEPSTLIPNLIKLLGILSVIVAVIWIALKKFLFNKVGEEEYDEELKIRIEEAKKKGLEKLNIISEQIERVDPVVLNGVASVSSPTIIDKKSGIANFFGTIGKYALLWGKVILGVVAAFILSLIIRKISSSMVVFVLAFLVVAAGIGALGLWIYKKYEVESFVSQKTIDTLKMFAPNLVSKLGSDDNVRVSLPAITVYMFGDDQLYMYYQYLDIVTGKIFCEGVHEYFYEDIVGITSSQETKLIFKRSGLIKRAWKRIEYLRESISVVSSGCTHSESYIVDMGHSLLDTQFVGMRNLIRQKKAEK